ERVHQMLPDLPSNAQEAIRRSQEQEDRIRGENRAHAADVADRRRDDRVWQDAPTEVLPRV
ncbi:ABC transporter ATP-binding protein, partial [Gordonia sp. NPDC058843]